MSKREKPPVSTGGFFGFEQIPLLPVSYPNATPDDMGSFSGKNILVVGGTSGIGLALARQLKAQDASVWVASRQPSEALAGLGVTHLPLDVTGDVGGLAGGLPETLHGLAYCPGT